jgi:hypothetical protein
VLGVFGDERLDVIARDRVVDVGGRRGLGDVADHLLDLVLDQWRRAQQRQQRDAVRPRHTVRIAGTQPVQHRGHQ